MNKRIAHIFVLNVILIASQGEAGLDSSYEQPPQLNLSEAQRKELEDIDLPQDFIDEITEQIDNMSAKTQQNRRKRYFQDHKEEIHLENGLSNSSSSNSSKKGRKMVYEMKDDSEYVSENLYFRPIKILQIPLSFENILAFVVIVALAALGNIYLWKLFSKQRCSCKLCEGVYELGEKIGDGGFSSVYMAFKQRTNQQFVLKRIEMRDITEVDEVQFEAKQLIPLSHMNIVSYEDDFIHHDFTTLDTKFSYILIMEY